MAVAARTLLVFTASAIAGGAAAAAAAPGVYLRMPMDLYPPEARAAHLEGDVEASLTAGPSGKVDKCSAKGKDALAPLKAATCDILSRRIDFQPGTSAKSLTIRVEWRFWEKPTTTQFTDIDTGYGGAIPISPDRWFMTDDFPPSEISGRDSKTTITFDIGIDGRATTCKVVKSSGSPVLDRQTCNNVITRARFIPAIDDGGKPRATTGYQTIDWVG